MTAENIRECGKTENSMEKESSSTQRKIPGKEEYGTMEKESDGQMITIMLQHLIENKFLLPELL